MLRRVQLLGSSMAGWKVRRRHRVQVKWIASRRASNVSSLFPRMLRNQCGGKKMAS